MTRRPSRPTDPRPDRPPSLPARRARKTTKAVTGGHCLPLRTVAPSRGVDGGAVHASGRHLWMEPMPQLMSAWAGAVMPRRPKLTAQAAATTPILRTNFMVVSLSCLRGRPETTCATSLAGPRANQAGPKSLIKLHCTKLQKTAGGSRDRPRRDTPSSRGPRTGWVRQEAAGGIPFRPLNAEGPDPPSRIRTFADASQTSSWRRWRDLKPRWGCSPKPA